jgi:hypothetical protein
VTEVVFALPFSLERDDCVQIRTDMAASSALRPEGDPARTPPAEPSDVGRTGIGH